MTPQEHITKIVEDYKRMFADEYEVVKKGVEMKRRMAADEYASVEGMEYGRGLYEISETLHAMFTIHLTDEEIKWLKEGGARGHEGGRWFAKTFPEFRLPEVL